MEEALIALLLADEAVTAICGNRITPGWRDQGAPMPAVTMTVVSGLPAYHSKGASGLNECRVQFDTWAETYADAKQLARAIEAVLSGFSGVRGAVRFDGIFKQGERDLPEHNAPTRLNRTSLDFTVWAARAA